AGATSIPTLRAATGRAAAFYHVVVFFRQDTPYRPDQRPVLDGLWRLPIRGGIHSRTGSFPGLSGHGTFNGSATVATYDNHRRDCLLSCSRYTEPLTETVTVS